MDFFGDLWAFGILEDKGAKKIGILTSEKAVGLSFY